MLSGRYLDAPDPGLNLGDPLPGQQRQAARDISGGDVLADLRARGYTIVNSPSAFGSAAIFSADVVMQDGNMTQFEERLIHQSFAREALSLVSPRFISDQLRADVLAPIRHAEVLAMDPPARPFFLLGHLLSPHPPFLFGPRGERRPLPWCYELGCTLWATEYEFMGISRSEYAQMMGDQITFLNGQLLQMADRIAASDPGAIVILFSDHGARFDSTVTDEYYRTFFAARTPGRPGLFPPDVSPVNILTLLSNAYFDTSYPIRAYQAWESGRVDLGLAPRLPPPQ
jgi:hypothetical protein